MSTVACGTAPAPEAHEQSSSTTDEPCTAQTSDDDCWPPFAVALAVEEEEERLQALLESDVASKEAKIGANQHFFIGETENAVQDTPDPCNVGVQVLPLQAEEEILRKISAVLDTKLDEKK